MRKPGFNAAGGKTRLITIAVRCEDNHTEDTVEIMFPLDIQIKVAPAAPNIAEVIRDKIKHWISQSLPAGASMMSTSDQLFQPRHKDKWAIELWIMPR